MFRVCYLFIQYSIFGFKSPVEFDKVNNKILPACVSNNTCFVYNRNLKMNFTIFSKIPDGTEDFGGKIGWVTGYGTLFSCKQKLKFNT